MTKNTCLKNKYIKIVQCDSPMIDIHTTYSTISNDVLENILFEI